MSTTPGLFFESLMVGPMTMRCSVELVVAGCGTIVLCLCLTELRFCVSHLVLTTWSLSSISPSRPWRFKKRNVSSWSGQALASISPLTQLTAGAPANYAYYSIEERSLCDSYNHHGQGKCLVLCLHLIRVVYSSLWHRNLLANSIHRPEHKLRRTATMGAAVVGKSRPLHLLQRSPQPPNRRKRA